MKKHDYELIEEYADSVIHKSEKTACSQKYSRPDSTCDPFIRWYIKNVYHLELLWYAWLFTFLFLLCVMLGCCPHAAGRGLLLSVGMTALSLFGWLAGISKFSVIDNQFKRTISPFSAYWQLITRIITIAVPFWFCINNFEVDTVVEAAL